MTKDQVATLATTIVFVTGAFWGLYWLPVRALDQMGLTGAWGTVAITGAAVLLWGPLAGRRWRAVLKTDRVALVSIALGGAAFALYSIAFVYGRVAIIILLYFLTPVWSTLIARYVMGWHTPRLRVVAIALGLAGLAVMLSADGTAPLPRSAGEWMGLVSGLLWSVATTGIRSRSDLGPVPAAFVFALGAAAAAAVMAPFLEPFPPLIANVGLGSVLGLSLFAGAVWWGLSVVGLMWATIRLEPARVGILLMAEVVVGAISAALIAGEILNITELIGGALVIAAGILEVWPVRRPSSSASA
ncbi:DMT family transporter [Pseudovibrio exalbescens]|uniref:EamA-like transporter family protein n=1 Tax=Pseudovibrio exalbescens TaxID=197461 RepID=A0A1U7JEE2_9HYPH|nr:DMT family transporter [Pseudovibrio exalbescens]OKL43011.1 hypothetical protein A3843_14805 [Pseudovibrio exalbescens]